MEKFLFIIGNQPNLFFLPKVDQASLRSYYLFKSHSLTLMYKLIFVLLSIVCLSQSINLIYYSALPVSRLALFKALLSMDYLKRDLDNTFNTQFENKFAYFVRTRLTENYLNDISYELRQYNNVLVGSNNAVIGRSNLIVGDNNGVIGPSNWVFSEGFVG